MARDRSQKLTVTDTQLIRILGLKNEQQSDDQKDNCFKKHEALMSGVNTKLDAMDGKITKLDEAIRGNGKIGLKASVEALEKALERDTEALKAHEQHHTEKHQKADMHRKWKIGIICALVATGVTLGLGLYTILTEDYRQRKTAEIIIDTYIKTTGNTPAPKKP